MWARPSGSVWCWRYGVTTAGRHTSCAGRTTATRPCASRVRTRTYSRPNAPAYLTGAWRRWPPYRSRRYEVVTGVEQARERDGQRVERLLPVAAAVVVEDDRAGTGTGQDRGDDVLYTRSRPVPRIDR